MKGRGLAKASWHTPFAGGLALVVLLLATAWVSGAQSPSLTITGQVINGTAGGTVPPALSVTLQSLAGEEEIGTTALTGDGTFRFTGIEAEEGTAFVARTDYQGVTYRSEPGPVEPGETELTLPITIYETTADLDDVRVTHLHLLIIPSDEAVQIDEVYLIGNRGDRTYVGAGDGTGSQRAEFSLTLPAAAKDLTIDDGSGELQPTQPPGGGFAIGPPIRPGPVTVEIRVGYTLLTGSLAEIERIFDVPVSSVVLILPAGEWTLAGPGLGAGEPVDTGLGPALSYSAGPLAAGEPLRFRLVAGDGSAHTPRPELSSRRNTSREMAIGLAALAGAAVAISLFYRRTPTGEIPARVRPLVETLAALEDKRAAGEMELDEYQQQREELMTRLHQQLQTTPER